MKVISHRGNLKGRIPEQENHPSYIQAAIDAGYDVEVDVWYIDGKFYLGHDSPQYEVESSWLKSLQTVLWCHAKNTDAFRELLSAKLHCFWHENDRYTLTSKGVPWCYPDNYISGGITVVLGSPENQQLKSRVFGVCTDYSEDWTSR